MANDSDAERLVVLLEARIRDFEKNMAKASGTAGRSYNRMRRDSRTATQAMEADMLRSTSRINQALAASSARIGTFSKSFALGIAGVAGVGLGIPAAINAVVSSVRDLAKVSADARMAGLGIETFQELKYAADKSDVSVEALTRGMKELQKSADEFSVTGKGVAAEAFQRIGMSRDEVKERLKDPADLLNEIINRVGKLSTAAQISIMEKLFGGRAGQQFLGFLGQGRDGIEMLRKAARETGNVLSSDIVNRADEIDKKFQSLSTKVGTALKGAIVEAAAALGDFLAMLPGAEVPIEKIGQRSIEITKEIIKLEQLAAEARDNFERRGTAYYEKRAAAMERRIEALKAEDTLLQRRGAAAVAERDRKNEFNKPSTNTGLPVADATANAQSAFDRMSESITKRTELLGVEAKMIDATAAARERARVVVELETAARRANQEAGLKNTEVTEEQRAKINALANAYEQARGQLEALNGPLATFARESANVGQQLEHLAVQSLDRMGDELADVVMGTKTVEEAFRSMTQSILAELSKIILKQTLLGPLASMMGGGGGGGPLNLLSFMTGKAEGGYISGPGTATSDSIPAMLSDGEFVVRASQTKKFRPLLEAINAGGLPGFAQGGLVNSPAVLVPPSSPRAAAQTTRISVGGPTVIVQGDASENTVKLIDARLAEYSRALPGVVIKTVRDAKSRRAI